MEPWVIALIIFPLFYWAMYRFIVLPIANLIDRRYPRLRFMTKVRGPGGSLSHDLNSRYRS